MAKNFFNRAADMSVAPLATPVAPTVVVEPAKAQLPATPDAIAEMGFDPAENLKDETPDIPLIKILPQAQMFAMPDDSKIDKIEGVVLETYRCNAWWDKDNPEEGNRPTCSSLDDIKPLVNSPHPQSDLCATCKLNQFGSEVSQNGEKGRGKACKNMRRMYILLDGHEFPYQLSLSPTSLREGKRYLTQLTDRKRNIATVVTRITLDKQTSGSNVYSVAEFASVRDIDDMATLASIAKIKKQVHSIAHAQAITGAEYETGAEPF